MQLQRDKIEGEEVTEIQQKHHLTQTSAIADVYKLFNP